MLQFTEEIRRSKEAHELTNSVNVKVRQLICEKGFTRINSDIKNIVKLEYFKAQKKLKNYQEEYQEYSVFDYYEKQSRLLTTYKYLSFRSIEDWKNSLEGYIFNKSISLREIKDVV